MVLHSSSEGFPEIVRFFTGLIEPVIQWSPAALLCMSQLPNDATREPPDPSLVQQPSVDSAVFVWDPRYGAVVSRLDSEASAALCKLGEGHFVTTSWSPSCQYLLVHGVKLEYARPHPGWLALVDFVQGTVNPSTVGYSELIFPIRSTLSEHTQMIVWHPSSAIVLQADITLADTAAIHQAGVATGVLPTHFNVDPIGFSADGKYLVATSYETQAPPLGPRNCFLLSCSIEGLQPRFQVVHALKDMHGVDDLRMVSWLPRSSTLLMHFKCQNGTFRSLLHMCGLDRDTAHAALGAPAYDTFSPSGRFFILQSQDDSRAIQVADVTSGVLCWDAAMSDPRWPNLDWTKLLQAQCSSSSGLHGLHRECHGWMPSGLGWSAS